MTSSYTSLSVVWTEGWKEERGDFSLGSSREGRGGAGERKRFAKGEGEEKNLDGETFEPIGNEGRGKGENEDKKSHPLLVGGGRIEGEVIRKGGKVGALE